MIVESLQKLEKLINSELASKIQKSIISHNEFLIEINESDLNAFLLPIARFSSRAAATARARAARWLRFCAYVTMLYGG